MTHDEEKTGLGDLARPAERPEEESIIRECTAVVVVCDHKMPGKGCDLKPAIGYCKYRGQVIQ